MRAKPCPADGDNTDMTGIEVSGDCEMKLRICGGRLQVCDCGTWVDVPSCDDEGAPVSGSQPGAGSGTPAPGGGTRQDCGGLAGNQKWYMPFAVKTGGAIPFSLLLGAANDSGEPFWHCPHRSVFLADACW